MVQRIALLLGSLAAAAVLTVALVAAGFAPAPASSVAATSAPQPVEAVAEQISPEPTTQVDTVYVKPAPPRKTIRLVRPTATLPPIVMHRVVKAPSGGEGGGDGESGGQDD